MRKNVVFYFISSILLTLVLLFFNKGHRQLVSHTEHSNNINTVHNSFQNLSRQIKSAATLNPDLLKASGSSKAERLFIINVETLYQELDLLKASATDTVIKRIVAALEIKIKKELSWIMVSNVPDSIVHHNGEGHIAELVSIDSLLESGIQRTAFLQEAHKQKLSSATVYLRTWMLLFIFLSGILLIYTTANLFRQQSKRKLKELELETVFNRISDRVISVDNEWRYTFLNAAALVNHPRKEDVLGKTLWDVHPKMEGTIFGNTYHEAMRTRQVREVESYYAPRDTWFWVKVYPSGDGLTVFYKDVTERKLAEERLIKSERIYKTIASSIPGSVICLLDADYRYLLIEGDMLEKLGYSKQILLGNKAADVLPPEAFAPLEREFEKALNGQTITRESSRNGYDIISRYVPLKDENNRVYAIMTVAMDITELKNAQRAVIELNRGLEEKIKSRTEQLRKTNEELEAFSYSVSHDLRAPLRGIIAFAKILEEEYGPRLDSEAKRITAVIRDSTLKMGNLIDDLLSFSRMGKQGLSMVHADTRQLVEEIVNGLMQQQERKNKISWNIHDLPVVKADVNTLRQVWINLISNAIKYSANKDSPHIQISFYKEEGQVVFYVRDNGAGFDEAYKDKLFKVFQRLHDADEFEGTGVGLALVERIISRHGGRVWAEGKEEEGACFYFSLPLRQGDDQYS